MKGYQLAEINIARMKGVSIDDPIMLEFANNLDTINELAESSEGFVWRLKDDENPVIINPKADEQLIINISVWKSIETLEDFVFKTYHSEFLRRRKEWFHKFGSVSTAMWWIPENKFPTEQQAFNKLEYLQKNGHSLLAFDFKNKYNYPD